MLTKVVLQAIPVFFFSALPTPKGVIQKIRSIQRDFLWGKGEEKKKWALVAWDKLYKPKAHEGLGLHDLEILSRVSGVKLWWRWLKELATPWEKLWKKKYAKNWQERDYIKMSGHIKGSHIWNLALENRGIVQHHSFWEIRAGNLARFWEDNWYQEPNLFKEGLSALKNDTDNKGLLMVRDFWDQVRDNGKWKMWKNLGYNEERPLKAQADSLALDLEKRKILVSSSSDQLRWGQNTEGRFNLKEAKCKALGFDYANPDRVWNNLWRKPQWMKVKLFMWLVHQKKILTWENLLKIGFVGPSKCHLCGLQEEMMEHLLNHCPFTSILWDWAASVFRQTDRDRLNITNTLKNWRKDFSGNKIINKD